jgi:hypothetical protein
MVQKKFSVGDLVSFRASARVFESANDRYSNPGIVLLNKGCSGKRYMYTVMWNDGKITSEWDSYVHAFEPQAVADCWRNSQ